MNHSNSVMVWNSMYFQESGRLYIVEKILRLDQYLINSEKRLSQQAKEFSVRIPSKHYNYCILFCQSQMILTVPCNKLP